MNRCVLPGRWAWSLGLALALLVPAAGCRPKAATEHAEVSGKVLFKGQPLPGGRVQFVAVQGAFASNATVAEDGTYTINAPVGDVQITVDNRMLLPRNQHDLPGNEEMYKKTGGGGSPIKGTYVSIPPKYYFPDKSELTYTVVPGAQTHDILLD